MKGYYNMPEQTAKAVDQDGWLHTGDLGVKDEAGRLRFDGRLKDMFRVGGENVAPAEVEDVLHRHPLRCPVGFIAGTRSTEIRQGGIEGARRLAGDNLLWLEGSHLYPMERPQQTAEAVLNLLRGMQSPRPGIGR